ncbi:MAG: PepSY domain-containing protein, partial [Methylobacteriaceae bacterium]|nr:PepSY domain-containing protein [Methylobacteriaceae bacterium]
MTNGKSIGIILVVLVACYYVLRRVTHGNFVAAGQRIRAVLLVAHRWMALILFPVFTIMLITGGILALKPVYEGIVNTSVYEQRAAFDVETLKARITEADPDGKAMALQVSPDGKTMILVSGGRGAPMSSKVVDIASGAPAAAASGDIFDTAKRVHMMLFPYLKALPDIAAIAMVILMLSGPFLVWPRIKNTLLGWHFGFGIVLFPLLLIIPLSALLIDFGGSQPPAPRQQTQPGLSGLVQVLDVASREADMKGVISVRSMRGMNILQAAAADGVHNWFVTPDGLKPNNGPGLLKQIHEGLWGGTWGGLVNFAGAVVLMLLNVT